MLIKGSKLTAKQRKQVLSTFVMRWTIENAHVYNGKLASFKPSIEPITDEQWITEHAFYFVKDGSRLDQRKKHCEPFYMAD